MKKPRTIKTAKTIKTIFILGVGFVLWVILVVLQQPEVTVFTPEAGSEFASTSISVSTDTEVAVVPKPKIRILIVPGHEPGYGGAQFGNINERDLVVELAQDLQKFLQTNDSYQVFITRDTQSWDPTFADYFKNNTDSIVAWEKAAIKNTDQLISVGSLAKPVVSIIHIKTATDPAVRLYGITKWSNENNIDLMIHVHLNDYPGHSQKTAGEYSGFAIYLPAQHYSNSTTTHAISEDIFKHLAKYNPVSNFDLEVGGLIDDPELIAVGANNTSKAPSMLIEYSYLYEPQLVNPKTRATVLKDLAYQTFLGLQDFYGQTDASAPTTASYDTSVLPYVWNNPLPSKGTFADIYALQTALESAGFYPPAGETMTTCPRSGVFGTCTWKALFAFQTKYGITGKDGSTEKKTLDALNAKF
jgi:N-acetylmuramoyl-L-alanine amidase